MQRPARSVLNNSHEYNHHDYSQYYEAKPLQLAANYHALGLALDPSDKLKELLESFLTPKSRAALGDAAIKLVSKRKIFITPDQNLALSDYEKHLGDAPDLSRQQFRLTRQYQTVMGKEAVSIAFRLIVGGGFQSRLFAEPFFNPTEAKNTLVVGHVFDRKDIHSEKLLKVIEDDFDDALWTRKYDSKEPYTPAPPSISANNLRIEQRAHH